MKLCRVIGHVVATSKHSSLEGRTILVVRPEEGRGDMGEAMQLAIDGVGAGLGSEVIVTESGAAGRDITGCEYPPVRSVIVGIVD
ncbi:MAG: EutN/CcmL family microcompartment protein [Gemmatimonadetes bacterium]|nr:EutN/CcmL family microcompartment protein [Gemmatimonadota bacterium]